MRSRSLAGKLGLHAADLFFYRSVFKPAEWLGRRCSPLRRQTFFDPSLFGWVSRIEAGWTAIRDELRLLLRERERIPSFHEISPEQSNITQDDKWKTYMLYVYGQQIAENCGRCPQTTRLLEGIPRMRTAFFSILGPRKHIPEHTGPYAGVLRYHLGLIVPRHQEDACRIRVGRDVAHWEEGKSLVFDDTYPHEVWNDTDEERVVLFVDFARPMWFPVSVLNEAVIRLISWSSFVQHVVEGAEEWNRKPAPGATVEPPVAARTRQLS
jgi:ornithine lipid ester-linked acyl 2-hydroxylase